MEAGIDQKALERLFIEDQDFANLEKALSPYCPFEAVGMVHAEIRHSTFLANMLDPYRPHGFGAAFLKRFLDEVMRQSSSPVGLSRLTLHLADFDRADVRREWRRIDVLICLADLKLVAAFELKIGASEGGDQLARYSRALEEEWPTSEGWKHLKYFLTRDAEAASDPAWQAIDYQVVTQAVDLTLSQDNVGTPLARTSARAYADMLRRHHLTDPELERIAQSLWQRHAEALNFLMARQPDAAGDMLAMMRKRRSELLAAARLSGLDVQIPAESSNDLIFAIRDWDHIPGMQASRGKANGSRLLMASIERRSAQEMLRGQLILGPCEVGAEEQRRAIFDAAKAAAGKSSHRLADQWKWLATAKLHFLKDGETGKTDEEQQFQQAVKRFGEFFRTDVKRISDALLAVFPADRAKSA